NWLNYSSKDGSAAAAVQAIRKSRDGNLWFGTQAGVLRLALTEGRPTSNHAEFTRLTANNGLAGNSVQAIAESADGKIWIATAPPNQANPNVGFRLFRSDGSSNVV